ncbi:MAG: glycosyltransferase N-terminal domain-containing protein [Crocinitomicaceae bacterium]|nr:glycosyltransferase N-terminal domain-containing protein [Crocinitomicaceae bacterium]
MQFLYTFGVRAYGLAIRLASLFTPKAKKWLVGRKNWTDNLPETNNKDVIWFHCASLGEFDQGLPLMTEIKSRNPEVFLLVTFFSPSGFEHYEKRDHQADFVCYLPLDTPNNARVFIQHFAPKQSFFVKYEFWGNYILSAKKNGSEIYNVSGIFRPSQRFFKWHGGFFRKILKQFDHFFVQNQASEDLLNSIDIANVTITGDSRFDRVIENREKAKDNAIIESFKGNEELLIVGSSWPADEAILIPWINKSSKKILIAPHQVDDKHVEHIIAGISRKVGRYSTIKDGAEMDFDVLILDTIGHLASSYKYGTLAYVGGGFSGSLHNILEPAVFGLPVIFGPKHTRFPEAQAFIDGGFGFSIETTAQFENSFETILSDLNAISAKERAFVEANAGASKKIFQSVFLS